MRVLRFAESLTGVPLETVAIGVPVGSYPGLTALGGHAVLHLLDPGMNGGLVVIILPPDREDDDS
jgi:hypothetical protein